MILHPTSRGSILFILLICIVLFVGLMFAVSYANRGVVKNASGEKAQLTQAQSENCTAQIDNAIGRLKIVKGCTDDQISYELPGGGNVNPDAPTDKHCHLFFRQGAGATPCGSYLEVTGCTTNLTTLTIGQQACGLIYAGVSSSKRIYTTTTDHATLTRYSTTTPVTGITPTSFTNGAANTAILVAAGGKPAASLCAGLGPEWYLPSRNELVLVDTNVGLTPGGITTWSSTLVTPGGTAAWARSPGMNINSGVTGQIYVRCVRSD